MNSNSTDRAGTVAEAEPRPGLEAQLGDAHADLPSGIAEKRQPRRVLAILSALMGFGSISTDLYLPAMPAMGEALGADAGHMELTVSGFLIGFSLGQLFWGPISDRYGRRPPVAIGIVLFVLGSAGCALAQGPEAMIGWRIVQAVGACAGVALSRAMVRDLYDGPGAARMLSTLITVMAIAPLIGPLLGGQILAFAGWRAIFWVLVVVGLGSLAVLFTLPETLPAQRRNREPLSRAFGRYVELLGRRRVLGYAGVGGFFYGGAFAFIAGSPFAYITYHHVPSSLYGFLFGLGILGIMAVNMLNGRLVARFGPDGLLGLGALLVAASGIAVGFAAGTDAGGLWGLVLPLFVFLSLNGLIVANSIAGAMADFPERAGAVSALVGAIHYGSGIVASALVGALADGTPWPMGLVIALCGVGSLCCMGLVRSAAVKAT
ncbi:MAG TPA: multidrug effflux MFS transporter [Bosea sp. (in: a-proteobacteria)]|jgi:DHA1 family bicyclomycin/chloramphenicol resistance-like MFS transporter|uniref:multidrug effflux MFS transporter n=1 Tax=Bosea sp. (in: a-proteobacteria) TaxID=1871050 RepID=UPI002E11E14A|nr:multidrug effflux MFS transporter [Bosea sp. (in: a-proteobacteria)]